MSVMGSAGADRYTPFAWALMVGQLACCSSPWPWVSLVQRGLDLFARRIRMGLSVRYDYISMGSGAPSRSLPLALISGDSWSLFLQRLHTHVPVKRGFCWQSPTNTRSRLSPPRPLRGYKHKSRHTHSSSMEDRLTFLGRLLWLSSVSTLLTCVMAEDAPKKATWIFPYDRGYDYEGGKSVFYLGDTIIATYVNCDGMTNFACWCGDDGSGGLAGDDIWKGKFYFFSSIERLEAQSQIPRLSTNQYVPVLVHSVLHLASFRFRLSNPLTFFFIKFLKG